MLKVYYKDEYQWELSKADLTHWSEVKLQTFFTILRNAVYYFCVAVPDVEGQEADMADRRGRPSC
jgi:hypothetical protein